MLFSPRIRLPSPPWKADKNSLFTEDDPYLIQGGIEGVLYFPFLPTIAPIATNSVANAPPSETS
uniref:Uncharacterized protein n=1 Tax=viral metagenome TaxID=1070528 RepID=A0A6C0KME5_9ZZZZ